MYLCNKECIKIEFPKELRNEIEKQAEKFSVSELKRISQTITHRYKNESGEGKRLVTEEAEALVYSIVRMPATFGAVAESLRYVFENIDIQINSLLDVGAGTGAGAWAIDSYAELKKVTCLEREQSMKNLGKKYMQKGSEALKNAEWISTDIVSGTIPTGYDAVIASYVLNELSDSDRALLLNKLWDSSEKLLLIIEPGTPEGFRHLRFARKHLLERGAHIAAPCFHEEECRIAEDDWCHFTVRIQRSRIHKLIKDGDVPYEDEKFSYIAFVREKTDYSDHARILRHPIIEKGRIGLEVCTKSENKSIVITKKDKELFKSAKKSKCGDSLVL